MPSRPARKLHPESLVAIVLNYGELVAAVYPTELANLQ